MKLAHFYLNFPGTAREAFHYYEKVFQTKIVGIQTFGDTDPQGTVPPHAKDKVMHVQLPLTDGVHLMGSDVVGGTVTVPIGNAPWGPYFGMCHDRFGIPWMVSLDHAV